MRDYQGVWIGLDKDARKKRPYLSARALFVTAAMIEGSYERFLHVDLCFQEFEEEIAESLRALKLLDELRKR